MKNLTIKTLFYTLLFLQCFTNVEAQSNKKVKYESFYLENTELSVRNTCKKTRGTWESNSLQDDSFELYTSENLEYLEKQNCVYRASQDKPYKIEFYFDQNQKLFGMANYYNFNSWSSRDNFLINLNNNIDKIFSTTSKKLAINLYKIDNDQYSVRMLLNDVDTKSFDFFQGEARPIYNYFLVVFITK